MTAQPSELVAHSRTHTPPHAIHLGLPIFLATFAVYAALVPWLVRVWQRTGDEPHYLLAAHSLAFDGDLDLGNNYAQRDYLSFYGDANLIPHTRPGRQGQAVLMHNLGLSLLIAPAYRLGGFTGVEYFLAGLGALLAANVFLLGHQLSGNWLAALIGWLAVSFTPPVLWYVFLVYPEMTAGLCLIFILRHLLDSPKFAAQNPPANSQLATRNSQLAIRNSQLAIGHLSFAHSPWPPSPGSLRATCRCLACSSREPGCAPGKNARAAGGGPSSAGSSG